MVRDWFMMPRSMFWRIHHVAWVEKRKPRSGSNFSRAWISPITFLDQIEQGMPGSGNAGNVLTKRRLCSSCAGGRQNRPGAPGGGRQLLLRRQQRRADFSQVELGDVFKAVRFPGR